MSNSHFESLPAELLHQIISYLKEEHIDISRHLRDSLPTNPNSNNSPISAQRHLLSCLTTSRTLYTATTPIIYHTITLSNHLSLQKFSRQINKHSFLGKLVKKLDLDAFHCKGYSFVNIQEIVMELLGRMPGLLDLKMPREWDGCAEVIDAWILRRLVGGELTLRRLEWGPSTSLDNYKNTPTVATGLTHLTIRTKAPDIAPFISKILTTIPLIHHLDFTTSEIPITSALSLLPQSTTLKSLRLKLTTPLTVKHLATQISQSPSRFQSLHTFSLQTTFLSTGNESDMTFLLSQLPATLKSLNLSGLSLLKDHLNVIKSHCPELEELNAGTGLKLRDLEKLVLPGFQALEQEELALIEWDSMDDDEMVSHLVLGPMKIYIAICKLSQRLNSLTLTPSRPNTLQPSQSVSKLECLDIRGLSIAEQQKLRTSVLLGEHSRPLKIIRVSERSFRRGGMLSRVCEATGWRFMGSGRETWIFRE